MAVCADKRQLATARPGVPAVTARAADLSLVTTVEVVQWLWRRKEVVLVWSWGG